MLGENIGQGFSPSTFSMKIEGGKELFAALSTLPKNLERTVERGALREAGKMVRDRAKQLCPVGTMEGMSFGWALSMVKRVPGALRNSIKMLPGRRRKNQISVVVGTSQGWFTGPEYYGGFVEFGTYKWKGKPFVRPAFDSQQENIINKITNGINTALMKIWMGRKM
jgi:HK97 gp10 family phage protein